MSRTMELAKLALMLEMLDEEDKRKVPNVYVFNKYPDVDMKPLMLHERWDYQQNKERYKSNMANKSGQKWSRR